MLHHDWFDFPEPNARSGNPVDAAMSTRALVEAFGADRIEASYSPLFDVSERRAGASGRVACATARASRASRRAAVRKRTVHTYVPRYGVQHPNPGKFCTLGAVPSLYMYSTECIRYRYTGTVPRFCVVVGTQ